MDNTNLNISFGIRPKRPFGAYKKRVIAKRIIKEAKNMYGENCPHLLRGETRFGDEIAIVTINTNKGTLYVEPEHFTEDALKKLLKFFHKDI